MRFWTRNIKQRSTPAYPSNFTTSEKYNPKSFFSLGFQIFERACLFWIKLVARFW